MSRLITLTIVIGLGWYLLLPVFSDRALDLHDAPYLNPGTRYGAEKTYEAQSTGCRATYVLAISVTGDWFHTCGKQATPDELMARALTMCRHYAQSACGIWATGGQTTPFQLTTGQLTYPTIYSSAAIPFIRKEVRDYVAYYYERGAGKRALAISRHGHFGIAVDMASEAEAAAAAITDCESKKGAAGKCFLYASGLQTVFSRTTNIYPDRPR